MDAGDGGRPRPRRAASARLDLALALVAGGSAEEAVAVTSEAITSGLLVPSHRWLVRDVLAAVGAVDTAGADSLRRELADVYDDGAGKHDAPHRIIGP
jgi:hypothetical protein